MEYLVKIDNFGGQYSHYEGTIIEGHPDGTRWGRMCGLPHIGIICCPDATVEDTEILTQPLINIVDSDFMDDQYIHMRRSLVVGCSAPRTDGAPRTARSSRSGTSRTLVS